MSKFFITLYDMLSVKYLAKKAYHPRTIGQFKRYISAVVARPWHCISQKSEQPGRVPAILS